MSRSTPNYKRTADPNCHAAFRVRISTLIEVLSAAGRYSQLKRKFPADDPRVLDARRDLVTARLIEHVKQLMASTPPLTGEQVEAVATVLRGEHR